MLSPLFEGQNFFFDDDIQEGWDLTDFHREAAALSDMAEFWADVEAEAESLAMVPPANTDITPDGDWAIRQEEPEDRKDSKLVNHDCMWNGVCEDSGHPSNTFVPPTQSSLGRSLLKRSSSPARPETPPSLDEEEPPQFQHTVDVAETALRLLRDSAAVAADHSYTLAKPIAKHKYENLGVQTPSDSEEEIDVVSLVDKSPPPPLTACVLPRAPSAMERRHIQRTVAVAMAPRHGRGRQAPGRKRTSSQAAYSPPMKRARGPGRRPRRSFPDTDSDPDMPDLEKRSLHNDMERQRRIGLKNLFDQLKEQIPSIREKERAPKVVILREAACLCRRLRADDCERDALLRQQAKLKAKLTRLRMHFAARYNTP